MSVKVVRKTITTMQQTNRMFSSSNTGLLLGLLCLIDGVFISGCCFHYCDNSEYHDGLNEDKRSAGEVNLVKKSGTDAC